MMIMGTAEVRAYGLLGVLDQTRPARAKGDPSLKTGAPFLAGDGYGAATGRVKGDHTGLLR